MGYRCFDVEVTGKVAHVRMSRPDEYNSMVREFWTELPAIVGELDENVDPASTTQVVAALQKAGKTFDYMPIVGAGHGAAETPYGSKLRLEFLKRHLFPQSTQRGTEAGEKRGQ